MRGREGIALGCVGVCAYDLLVNYLRTRRSATTLAGFEQRRTDGFMMFHYYSLPRVAVIVAFSSLVRIWGECSPIHIPSALFFFSVEISSCTPAALCMPGSVHSGLASSGSSSVK